MLLERGSKTFESSSFANTKQNRFHLEGSCLVCLFCLVCLHIHRDIGCLLHSLLTCSTGHTGIHRLSVLYRYIGYPYYTGTSVIRIIQVNCTERIPENFVWRMRNTR
jgi:hypothetical protein